MAEVKQILVVDDHFEMLEFLRSMLEMSSQEYEVLGVPSAEEGFLELSRIPFDLLITDVRLPGISGFELVRRVQKVQPEIPIIMITAYSSSQGKEEAEQLGVFRYFQKPLDTEALMAAVHHALYGEAEIRTPAVEDEDGGEPIEISPEVQERLRTLRTDTGAAQVTLATAEGRVALTVGDQRGVRISRVAQIIADNLRNGLFLAEELDSIQPLMIHYQAGEHVDLYSANIGRAFFLILLFDVQARRGRIGTVWIFAQRAIKTLGEMLPMELPASSQKTERETEAPIDEKNSPQPRPARSELPPSSDPVPGAARRAAAPEPAVDAISERISGEAARAAPETIETSVEAQSDPELEALFDQMATNVDLDAFWTAAASEEGEMATSGVSFEEALRKGLIPPDLAGSDE